MYHNLKQILGLNLNGRLKGTGQHCGLVSILETGFYKGLSVSISVLDGKKVLYLQVYGMGLSNPGHT